MTSSQPKSDSERHTRFLALAALYREHAAKTQDAELMDGYSKLADGYEALARGFATLARQGGLPRDGAALAEPNSAPDLRNSKDP